ncbi:hypothetical protein [Sphingomonas sp. M1A8_2b]
MKAQTMRRVRRYHFYLGMFFAPGILLFALSGALQTFRLQEAKGYGGTPPGWIVWMASVHKDQSLPREKQEAPRAAKSSAMPAKPSRGGEDRPFARISPLPLKIFVAVMAVGLLLSALLGIVVALTSRTMRRTAVYLLAAGTILPLLLLLV